MKTKIITLSIALLLSLPFGMVSLTVSAQTTALPSGTGEYGAAKNPQYTLLAPLPPITGDTTQKCTTDPLTKKVNCAIDIKSYFTYIFKLAIAVAVFLAVVMITWGGFRYMTVESINGKSDAKDIIQNAVLGLLGALGSYLILYTINPQLVDLSLVTVPSLNLKDSTDVLNKGAFTEALMAELKDKQAEQNQYLVEAQTAQNKADQLDQIIVDHCESDNSDYTEEQCTSLDNQYTAAQNEANQATYKADILGSTVVMDAAYQKILNGSTAANDNLTYITKQYNDAMAKAQANNDIAGQQKLTAQYNLETAGIQGYGYKTDLVKKLITKTETGGTFIETKEGWEADRVTAIKNLQNSYKEAMSKTSDPVLLQQYTTQESAQYKEINNLDYYAVKNSISQN